MAGVVPEVADRISQLPPETVLTEAIQLSGLSPEAAIANCWEESVAPVRPLKLRVGGPTLRSAVGEIGVVGGATTGGIDDEVGVGIVVEVATLANWLTFGAASVARTR